MATGTTDLNDRVNARVKEGWHFRNTGTEVYAYHDSEPRYHRTSKVADLLDAIDAEDAAREAAKAAEAANAVSVVSEGEDIDWSKVNQ